MHRLCNGPCGLTKPITEFVKRGHGYYRYICKKCYNASKDLDKKKEYRNANRERLNHNVRDRKKRLKQEVFAHYGNTCVCCGETQKAFLTVDHINNDGSEHRKEIGRASIIPWLVFNQFPDGFQILCMNCNLSKGINGKCHHQIEREAALSLLN